MYVGPDRFRKFREIHLVSYSITFMVTKYDQKTKKLTSIELTSIETWANNSAHVCQCSGAVTKSQGWIRTSTKMSICIKQGRNLVNKPQNRLANHQARPVFSQLFYALIVHYYALIGH